ncbi:T9SS type B sorting domain-containing protein [Spongiivirga citrea]|uniref:T9SS type B sorting domain-containing protein n=1 Tax=Spongiivirga citrea TaxID=1481457 RepID=A0A6M0CMR6_9FLAO|nr:T9SS type B sorting domain-containing protein [Spongiivirga citrea]NER16777.1 T9SS type B sorting domain-containing protein [Spongiivirga citrea]
MTKKLLYFFLVLISCQFINGQQETAIWYFGEYAGLDFRGGDPVELTDSAMRTIEGTSVIATATGDLRFYTNGVNIWNRNHQIMPNGSGLKGDSNSTQSSLVVQRPGSTQEYFLFTVEEYAGADGFSYSVVDMALDGGLGAVTSQKNIQLATPVMEKLTAVKHRNGRDVWVIVHGWPNTDFQAYLVTDAGVNTTPIISNVGADISTQFNFTGEYTLGYLKASPDGRKLAIAHFNTTVELLDFNNETGIVSNPIRLDNPTDRFYGVIGGFEQRNFYGLEFSASGDRLYVAVQQTINSPRVESALLQYDLTAADIPASEIVIDRPLFLIGAIQLAPNGKMYVANQSQNSLGVINNPEALGTGCNYQKEGFALSTRSFAGLPQFNQSLFVAGISAENLCLASITEFKLNANQIPDAVVWNFDDPASGANNTSTLENPTHTFSALGTYMVTAQATIGGIVSDFSKEITINSVPSITNIEDFEICDNDADGFAEFDLSNLEQQLINGQTNVNVRYFNEDDDVISSPISDSYVNTIANQQQITARVENVNDAGCYSETSFKLIVHPKVVANPVANIAVCDDNNDGFFAFNTATIESTILDGQTGLVVTYENENGDLLPSPLPNPFTNTIANRETIKVRVTNPVTMCDDETSFALIVNPSAKAFAITDLHSCDENNDGFADFNTSTIEQEVLGTQTGVKVRYFDENGTELPSPLPNPFTNTIANLQTIRVRVENELLPTCFEETSFKLIVDPTPTAHPLNDILVCDDDNDGFADFDLTVIQNEVLNGQTGLEITVFDQNGTALPNLLPSMYTNKTAVEEALRVKVTNPITECYDETTVSLKAIPKPVVQIIDDLESCDDDNDGFTVFDTSAITSTILDGQPDVHVFFYDGNNTFIGEELPDELINTVAWEETITARLEHTILSTCMNEIQFKLIVKQTGIAYPVQNIEECDADNDGFIDFFDTSAIESTVLNGQTDVLVSYFDGDGNELPSPLPNPYTNNKASEETITIRVTNPETSCFNETSFKFIARSCSDDIIFDFPKYFTPNGDGYHDIWQVNVRYEDAISRLSTISIYDRYGKLIKQISPQSSGWDGTFSGSAVPASDYWYTATIDNQKVISGHFALKR